MQTVPHLSNGQVRHCLTLLIKLELDLTVNLVINEKQYNMDMAGLDAVSFMTIIKHDDVKDRSSKVKY